METKTIELKEASLGQLDEINNLYLKCREHLVEKGILQWDDQYPNKEYFQECIEQKSLYVLLIGRKILGHVVLNEWESAEWDSIKWEGNHPLIIHSLMIEPFIQGKGLGVTFVKLCEQLAKEKGFKWIRLDAFSGNEKALNLYKKLGYQVKGSVFFRSKPEGHQEYICFEKEL